MKLNRVKSNVALVSSAGLAVVPMAFAATPSLAAADCGEGTEVAAGICEKAFTTAGDYTFTVPASVSKMSAVLVGGGQGGATENEFAAYAGSGGGVLFVDSVDLSAPLSFTVGAGDATEFGNGGDTTLGENVAGGGRVDGDVPVSGLPQESPAYIVDPGPPVFLISGGGAGGTPTDCTGGDGVTASSVAVGSPLFPALLGEPVFGQGGSCAALVLNSAPAPGKGGDVYPSGGTFAADAGADGAVILRWAAPALPDTGMNMQPWVIGASVAAVLGGAVLSSGALRVRRQGRHSN